MYFDGCYFDPTYFDAAPCATGGGRGAKGPPGRRRQIFIIPPEAPFLEEDDELFAVF